MDSSENQSENTSVIRTIFKFDDETKTTLMNIIQYVLVAFIPLVALQMASEKIFPKHHDEKGNVELIMEILGQSVFIIVGIFLIHRIVMVIPTFSGVAMGDINLFTIVIVFMLCAIIFPGNIQIKSQTLSDRLTDAWEGKSDETAKNKKKPHKQSIVSVSQPISGHRPQQHQPSRADQMNHQQPPIVPPNNNTLQPPTMEEQTMQGPPEPEAFNSMGGGFARF